MSPSASKRWWYIVTTGAGAVSGWALYQSTGHLVQEQLHPPDAKQLSEAQAAAADAVGCYATRLSELSEAIVSFRARTMTPAVFDDAAASLITPINNVNAAFSDAERRRLSLRLALAGAPRAEPWQALHCRVEEVSYFQWHRLRDKLNSALVPVHDAWRHGPSASSIAQIADDQPALWWELQVLLSDEARELEQTCRHGCRCRNQ